MHAKHGAQAREVFEDARALLDRIVEEKLLRARGLVGLFPANSVEDDVLIYADDERRRELQILELPLDASEDATLGGTNDEYRSGPPSAPLRAW